MTANTTSRPRGAMRPSRAFVSRPNEGVGNAGCPLHPQPRVRSVESTRVFTTVAPEHPAFPHAMVLTAYFVLSPVTGLFCHRRQRIWFCLSPVGPTQLRELDAGVGASAIRRTSYPWSRVGGPTGCRAEVRRAKGEGGP